MNTDLHVGYQVSRSLQDIFLSLSPDRGGQSWRKRVLRKDGKPTGWEQNKSLALNFRYPMDRPNLLVLQRWTHCGWFSSVRNLRYLCGPAQLHVRCVVSQTSGAGGFRKWGICRVRASTSCSVQMPAACLGAGLEVRPSVDGNGETGHLYAGEENSWVPWESSQVSFWAKGLFYLIPFYKFSVLMFSFWSYINFLSFVLGGPCFTLGLWAYLRQ